MLRRIVVLVSVILVAGLANNAMATAWTDAAPANHLWGTPGNWTGGGVPQSNNSISIRSMGGEYPLLDTGDYEGFTLGVQGLDPADIPTLTITGGSLTLGNSTTGEFFKLGHNADSYGIINIHGGALTSVGKGLMGTLGEGTLNMYGGEMYHGHLKVGARDAGVGYARLNLYGGTFNCGGVALRGDSITNITEGKIVVLGIDKTADMAMHVTNGNLVAYGGAGDVLISYDGTNTIVTGIPEPMTIALLGLGGLFIRRRK